MTKRRFKPQIKFIDNATEQSDQKETAFLSFGKTIRAVKKIKVVSIPKLYLPTFHHTHTYTYFPLNV